MALNVEIEADAGTDVIWEAFTNPANMSRWVQNFERVDEDHTCWAPWCRCMFTRFMQLMSLFTGGTIRKRTEGEMQRFKSMVESDLAGEIA